MSVLNADTSDPEYQGAEAGTAFNATLSDYTTYYWRVDAETASSTATGDVWTFTTDVVKSLETGLEGYWPLDETSGVTAADRSTNSNNGTVTNTTFDAGSVTGQFGNALQFDGSNDYINVPNHSSLNPTGAITVSAWIKADTWAANSWDASIVSKEQWASGSSGYVLRCGDNGKLSFSFSSGGGSFPEALSGSVMSTGTWYHVAGTFDGSTIKVYINGSEADSTSYSGSIGVSSYPLNIGRGTYAPHRIFDGTIDDVGIWDRALDTSEIAYLYNGGTGRAILYTLPGDFEPDGDVDGADLSYMVQRWLFTGCVSPGWCQGADLNHSGEVDLYDFAIFAENYLK
jgi:hypothetical protein